MADIEGTDAGEPLVGTDGDDTIDAKGGDDSVNGAAGNDTLHGGTGNDTIRGGGGIDQLYGDADNDTLITTGAPSAGSVYDGGTGDDTLELRPLPSTALTVTGFATSTVIGIETLRFVTVAGANVITVFEFGQFAGAGITQLIGGAGVDLLTLTLASGGGTYTTPELTLTDWGAGDIIYLSAGSQTGDFVLTAREGLAGRQVLIGGLGNDTLTGSSAADSLFGQGGVDMLDGGDGNDIFDITNGIPPFVGGAETHFTAAGSIYDGGAGTDTLTVGGVVDFAGTLVSIEAIALLPASGTAGNPGYRVAAQLTLSGAKLAALPANLALSGTGTIVVGLAPGDSYNASLWTVAPDTSITVEATGSGSNDTLLGGLLAETLSGGDGDDVLAGGDGDDELHGGLGYDQLFGGPGNDLADGGDGVDLFVYDVSENAAGGFSWNLSGLDPLVEATLTDPWGGTDTLRNIEQLAFWSGQFEDDLTGSAFTVSTGGLGFANNLDGGGGNDTLTGAGDKDWLQGDTGNDVLNGLGGMDRLEGGKGNDTLDGGSGADTMAGGTGNDRFIVDDAGDVVTELNGEGTDTVESSVSFNLSGQYVEVLTLTGSSNINATGNNQANTLNGNSGNNVLTAGGGNDTLNGGTGADMLVGGTGDDRYIVNDAGSKVTELKDEGTDTVESSVSFNLSGQYVEVLTLTGSGNINATGNNQANTLNGNAGNNVLTAGGGLDTLNGGTGADTMVGGTGSDRYIVDNAGDTVVELRDEGTDTVESSVSFNLSGQYVEVLKLTGSGNINATGNNQANTLIGNGGSNVLTAGAGNDTLNGGTGADTMVGGTGNDRFIVDNAGDTVTELKNEGTDTVESSVSFNLSGQYVEVLQLTGTANINATGNNQVNALIGNAGNNVLNGGGDADAMLGGAGNDRYIVDNAGDTVIELNNEGTDTIESSVSFGLSGQFVEVLMLTGSGNINATGDNLVNTLIGNAGNNVLDGGGNADTMRGVLGNDRYIVDNAGDVVIEFKNEGTDTVESSVSFNLSGQYIEVLTLTGSANVNATGNNQANTLIGNAGNNVLKGGGDADIMRGGAGDDRYLVDHAGDTVTELNGEGTDTVESSVSFNLSGQYVEVLQLTGSANINATGNNQANTLVGNSGSNVLTGGGGNDTLTGGGGADSFKFGSTLGAGNVDTITDYSVPNDGILLDDAVFTGLATGALSAAAFHTGAAAADASDRIIYNSATGALLFDVDGVGGVAAVQFATLTAGLAMTNSEFLVM